MIKRKQDSSDWALFNASESREAVKPRSETPGVPLGGLFFNRELSWLRFNDRVLSEAADPNVPVLERLRFASIVSSNLDEYFMVRVAEIAAIAARTPGFAFPDGLTAIQTLAQIRDHVLKQKTRQAAV